MTNGIIDSNQKIVTNGLVLHLDAGQRRSYSGTDTNWRDLISGTNAVLTNGPVFNSSNGGNISFGAARVDNVIQHFTNRECGIATIGDGLTDIEAANLYTAVQKYQTTLGRQV